VAAAAWAPAIAWTASSAFFTALAESTVPALAKMAAQAGRNPSAWYRVLKGFGRVPSIIMTAWFFEEVAEVIWAWYATLSGLFERKPIKKELPHPKWLEAIWIDETWYDGKEYGMYICFKSALDGVIHMRVFYGNEKPYDKNPVVHVTLSRKGEIKRVRIMTPTLPINITIDGREIKRALVPTTLPYQKDQFSYEGPAEAKGVGVYDIAGVTEAPPATTQYTTPSPEEESKPEEYPQISDPTAVPGKKWMYMMSPPEPPPGYEYRTTERILYFFTFTITAEDFIEGEKDYHANVMSEMIANLRDKLNLLDDVYAHYARLMAEWIDDREPTWKLKPMIESQYRLCKKVTDEAKALWDEILRYREEHLPWLKKPVITHTFEELPKPEEFPPRKYFQQRLDRIWGKIETAYRNVLELSEKVIHILEEFQKEVDKRLKEYETDRLRYTRLLEQAKAAGDMPRVAEYQARLAELDAKLKVDLVEMKNAVLEHNRGLFNDICGYINMFNEQASLYLQLTTPQVPDWFLEKMEELEVKYP